MSSNIVAESSKSYQTRNKELIGQVFNTKHGGKCKVLSVLNRKNIIVKFDNGHEATCSYQNLLKGKVLNPFYPKVYGVGFIGVGKYLTKQNGKITEYYESWRGALRRSYDKKFHKKCATYVGCSVDSRWHNYQDFCAWADKQVFFSGYKLDKDLLVRGNKIYGPDTCVYLPNELNCIISMHYTPRKNVPNGVSKVWNPKARKTWVANVSRRGDKSKSKVHCVGYFSTAEEASEAYIKAKKAYIKERTDTYKDKISEAAYAALIAWDIS